MAFERFAQPDDLGPILASDIAAHDKLIAAAHLRGAVLAALLVISVVAATWLILRCFWVRQ